MNRSTLERLAPLSGILFVALIIASFFVLGDTPDVKDSTDDVFNFWKDNVTEGQWAGGLMVWAAIAAIWFGASLRGALRRASDEADRLAALAFAGWVVFAVGAASFAGFNFAAADAADHDVTGTVVQTISVLGEDFFPIIAVGLVVALLAATAGCRSGSATRPSSSGSSGRRPSGGSRSCSVASG